jgi:hypothetical protein
LEIGGILKYAKKNGLAIPTEYQKGLWISSVPAGAKIYLMSLEEGVKKAQSMFPGEIDTQISDKSKKAVLYSLVKDEQYFKGHTPLYLDAKAGNYLILAQIPVYKDSSFEADGWDLQITGKKDESVESYGQCYEILKLTDHFTTHIALFQPRDTPLSKFISILPDAQNFQFNENEMTNKLRDKGVSETDITLANGILHRGGKVIAKTDSAKFIIEIKGESNFDIRKQDTGK